MKAATNSWRRRSRKAAAAAEKAREMPHRAITGEDRINRTRHVQKMAWVAPDSMPQWMVDLIKAGKMCGANLHQPNSAGKLWCELKPVPNQGALGRTKPYRCQWHGGAVPAVFKAEEAKKKRTVPIIDGVYSSAVLPGEEETWAKLMSTSSLDPEIAILKLRLLRAVRAEAEAMAAQEAGADRETMELAEHQTSSEVNEQGSSIKELRIRRPVDHRKRVHMVVNELAKILAQKALLQGEDVSDLDRARLAREALAEARASIGRARQDGDGPAAEESVLSPAKASKLRKAKP